MHTTYGIIGNPVEHSLSPVMHNTAFTALEVEATYELFPLEETELKDFFEELHKDSSPIFGLNVTVPYKEQVIPYLDSLTPLAQRIMAVNTITISKDRKLTGHNTDAPGFLSHLVELQFNTAGKKIAILGAGGSARAILGALSMIPERPESIKIYNRTPGRLKILLDDLGQRIDMSIVESVMSVDDLDIGSADLFVNTTSVGLNEEDVPLIDESLLHPDLLVYDLVYNPRETELLKMAKAVGAKTANGLGMLFYQGTMSLQHWAERELDESVKKKMRDALEGALQ